MKIFCLSNKTFDFFETYIIKKLARQCKIY